MPPLQPMLQHHYVFALFVVASVPSSSHTKYTTLLGKNTEWI